MTWLVGLLGGAGLILFLSGLPPLRDSSFRRRVEPYVGPAAGRKGAPRPGVGGTPVLALVRRLPVDRSVSVRLEAAGLAVSVDEYRLEQATWALGAALAACGALIGASALGGAVDVRVVPLLAAISLVSGFLARDWWLTQQVAARRESVKQELPVAIDLMTLSIMAGESVPAACARVAASLPRGIGAEFARAVADVRAGTPIAEALESMARRVPEVGVGRLVDALITGIEKGAPLADTLRAQADDGREARRRYLLEAGGRREVLMLVPVVFMIMPVVVVFALYPGLVTLELLVP